MPVMLADALDRSRWHAPQERAVLRAAPGQLATGRLLPRDIATALRLSERAVRDLLGVPTREGLRDRA